MRLLVTGALGFVGANLVRWLATSADRTILAADLRKPDDLIQWYWSPVQSHIQPVQLDVTQSQSLFDLVAGENVSHILHCAAITPSLLFEHEHPDTVTTVNLMGALNVLEAARRFPAVERLLLMSSSGVYGAPAAAGSPSEPDLSIEEESPLVLDNLYAITKRSTELLGARYRALCGKEVASIRLGPFYGPLERPSPSRPHVSVPGRLLAALQEGRPVTLSGAAVARDWIYAGDVAAAIDALLVAPRWHYDLYNLGAGRAISLSEMADAFVRYGLPATWVDADEKADIRMEPAQGRRTMSIRRLAKDAGWVASPEIGVHVGDCIAKSMRS